MNMWGCRVEKLNSVNEYFQQCSQKKWPFVDLYLKIVKGGAGKVRPGLQLKAYGRRFRGTLALTV